MAVRKLVTSICTSSKEKPDLRLSLLRIAILVKKLKATLNVEYYSTTYNNGVFCEWKFSKLMFPSSMKWSCPTILV